MKSKPHLSDYTKKYFHSARLRLISAEVVFVNRGTSMVIFVESNKMASAIRAMKAERELCLQDVTTFKKLREGIRDRKRKSWFTVN
jgi:hypothetical protein